VLTIVSRSPQQALKAEEMGQALQNVDGNGSHCYIFRSRVDEIAAFAHISSERLLDAAIAHELGHLLKGLNSHSPQGVMSGHWGEREIRAVGRGGLGFTKQDIEQIRKKLHQASSAGLQMDRITVQ